MAHVPGHRVGVAVDRRGQRLRRVVVGGRVALPGPVGGPQSLLGVRTGQPVPSGAQFGVRQVLQRRAQRRRLALRPRGDQGRGGRPAGTDEVAHEQRRGGRPQQRLDPVAGRRTVHDPPQRPYGRLEPSFEQGEHAPAVFPQDVVTGGEGGGGARGSGAGPGGGVRAGAGGGPAESVPALLPASLRQCFQTARYVARRPGRVGGAEGGGQGRGRGVRGQQALGQQQGGPGLVDRPVAQQGRAAQEFGPPPQLSARGAGPYRVQEAQGPVRLPGEQRLLRGGQAVAGPVPAVAGEVGGPASAAHRSRGDAGTAGSAAAAASLVARAAAAPSATVVASAGTAQARCSRPGRPASCAASARCAARRSRSPARAYSALRTSALRNRSRPSLRTSSSGGGSRRAAGAPPVSRARARRTGATAAESSSASRTAAAAVSRTWSSSAVRALRQPPTSPVRISASAGGRGSGARPRSWAGVSERSRASSRAGLPSASATRSSRTPRSTLPPDSSSSSAADAAAVSGSRRSGGIPANSGSTGRCPGAVSSRLTAPAARGSRPRRPSAARDAGSHRCASSTHTSSGPSARAARRADRRAASADGPSRPSSPSGAVRRADGRAARPTAAAGRAVRRAARWRSPGRRGRTRRVRP